MSGFTPGPWEVGPVDDTVVTHLGADGVRYEIAAIDGDYNQPDEWPVMEANARLIAAAPDLLEALKLCLPANLCLTNPNVHYPKTVPLDVPIEDLRKVAAAIAKAIGATS